MGIPSIAVSLVLFGEKQTHYGPAAAFAARLGRHVLREKPSTGFVINVNVPNLPASRLRGYEFTKLGKRDFGEVIVEKSDPRGRKYYWIAGNYTRFKNIPGSDGNAVKQRRISITPLQAGLGWVVAWDKPAGFAGKNALVAERERGVSRRLRGIATEGRRPPRDGCAVSIAGAVVGETTSGNFSPVLGHGIALAFLPPDVADGTDVTVDVRGSALRGQVVPTPFVKQQPS